MKLHFHGTLEKFAIILPLANMNVNNSTGIKNTKISLLFTRYLKKKLLV